MRNLTSLVIVIALVGLSSTALAQPGQPPPSSGWGPPYAPPPQRVTPEERALLERGEYSDGQVVGGGLLGSFFGLGLGHAVQGRFTEKGWIFLIGEAVGGYIWIYNLVRCAGETVDDNDQDDCNETMLVGSMVLVAVLRIWEIVDVWTHPIAHNRKVRRLRNRLEQQRYHQQPRWGFYAAPTRDGGGVAGIAVRF